MNRIASISESGTSSIRNKASELKRLGIPIINFAAGELSFDTTPEIKQAAIAAINTSLNQYTDTLGIKELRELLVKKVNKETCSTYSYDEIAVTAGAKQALFNSIMILFDVGDEVIIPSPCWGTFVAQVSLSGATPILFDTSEDDFQINIKSFEKKISAKTKGIILNSPNNPTGVIYDANVLIGIARLALKYNLWLIIDECYADLVWKPNIHYNIVKLFPEAKEKIILINSFSKSYSITGWRIGYLSAPKAVIQAMKKFQGHTTSNPNCIAQYAMIAELKLDNHQFSSNIQNILSRRLEKIMDILNTCQYISYVKPKGAFYIFINFRKVLGMRYKNTVISNINDVALILLDKFQIAVTPGDAFYNTECVRISYSIEEQEIILGLKKMKQFLEELMPQVELVV